MIRCLVGSLFMKFVKFTIPIMEHNLTTGETLNSNPHADTGVLAFASSCVKFIDSNKLSFCLVSFQSAK